MTAHIWEESLHMILFFLFGVISFHPLFQAIYFQKDCWGVCLFCPLSLLLCCTCGKPRMLPFISCCKSLDGTSTIPSVWLLWNQFIIATHIRASLHLSMSIPACSLWLHQLLWQIYFLKNQKTFFFLFSFSKKEGLSAILYNFWIDFLLYFLIKRVIQSRSVNVSQLLPDFILDWSFQCVLWENVLFSVWWFTLIVCFRFPFIVTLLIFLS